jgi:hypothetical protein
MLKVYPKYDWQKDRSIARILDPEEGGMSNDD